MALKYVNAVEGELGGACTNPKCKEELMRAINAAVPKSSVWKVASVLLLPVLIGFAVVYSVVTTADTKYAREVEVKVLAAQLGFVTGALGDMKESIKEMNSSISIQLKDIQTRQLEFYRQLGTHRERGEKTSETPKEFPFVDKNNYGSQKGSATK